MTNEAETDEAIFTPRQLSFIIAGALVAFLVANVVSVLVSDALAMFVVLPATWVYAMALVSLFRQGMKPGSRWRGNAPGVVLGALGFVPAFMVTILPADLAERALLTALGEEATCTVQATGSKGHGRGTTYWHDLRCPDGTVLRVPAGGLWTHDKGDTMRVAYDRDGLLETSLESERGVAFDAFEMSGVVLAVVLLPLYARRRASRQAGERLTGDTES